MGWTHLPISRIIHTLHGDLIPSQGGQLARDLRTDDGSHVPDLGRAAGENEGEFLAAAAVLGHAVLGG